MRLAGFRNAIKRTHVVANDDNEDGDDDDERDPYRVAIALVVLFLNLREDLDSTC